MKPTNSRWCQTCATQNLILVPSVWGLIRDVETKKNDDFDTSATLIYIAIVIFTSSP